MKEVRGLVIHHPLLGTLRFHLTLISADPATHSACSDVPSLVPAGVDALIQAMSGAHVQVHVPDQGTKHHG